MDKILLAAQLIVAFSVLYVWIFRFENIIIEFKQYGLSDLIRNIVGASKISLSALLIAGIFYPGLILFSSLSMAFFMFCAQLAHIKVKNPWVKFIPSLIFLILSLLIAAINMGLL
ncbi:MAG: DoxX family protein [Flavobacteriales bacterium]|jgi:hypothetical protein|nr:DoxX family protein [Flavobacteriaceae bacterium]|tara:strand:- start:484 stop:828 length:345 start_codon:yes stop_codon:yes gene_type:complete